MKTRTIVKTLIGVVVIGGGVGYFMYQAMQSSWSYYYSVDEFSANSTAVRNASVRIAGRVKQGTVARDLQKMQLTFTLAGSNNEVPVSYEGTVPDNFTEDIEVVVEGRRILCAFYSLYKFLWHTHSSNITSHIVKCSG